MKFASSRRRNNGQFGGVKKVPRGEDDCDGVAAVANRNWPLV